MNRNWGRTFRRGFLYRQFEWLASSALLSRVATSGRTLTDAGSLADIDGQIGLRPVRLELFVCFSKGILGVVPLTDSWWLQSIDAGGIQGGTKAPTGTASTAKPETSQRE